MTREDMTQRSRRTGTAASASASRSSSVGRSGASSYSAASRTSSSASRSRSGVSDAHRTAVPYSGSTSRSAASRTSSHDTSLRYGSGVYTASAGRRDPLAKTPAVTSREYVPHRKPEQKRKAAPPAYHADAAPRKTAAKQPVSSSAPKKKTRRKTSTLGVMWILVLCMVLVVGGVWAGGYYTSVVVDGVYADGIHLGGMTYDEAEARLAEECQKKLSQVRIEITDPEGGRTWNWDFEDIGAYISLEDLMAQVRAVGRQGSVFQRAAEVRALEETPVAFYTEIQYDETRLDGLVEAIKAEVNTKPTNAKVSFYPEEDRMWVITDEIPGKELNVELLIQQVMQDLVGDYDASVAIITDDVMPHYTAELLRRSTEKTVRFQTEVTGSSNRKDNIRQALKALNGKIIWPGQELSFNAATGERTAENGYKEAPTIGTNKGFEDNLGGGVCQVSTTLYNAALMADCTIVKWRSHSFPSTYVDKGLDAVVDWPHKDLVIRNDTEGPMFIRASYYRDKAEIIIYRLPFPDGITNIKLTSTVLLEGETPIPEERVDVEGKHVIYDDETYKEVLPRPYLEVRNTQQFFAGSELVEEKEIHVVKFQEIKGLTYIGATPASQRIEGESGDTAGEEPEEEPND